MQYVCSKPLGRGHWRRKHQTHYYLLLKTTKKKKNKKMWSYTYVQSGGVSSSLALLKTKEQKCPPKNYHNNLTCMKSYK